MKIIVCDTGRFYPFDFFDKSDFVRAGIDYNKDKSCDYDFISKARCNEYFIYLIESGGFCTLRKKRPFRYGAELIPIEIPDDILDWMVIEVGNDGLEHELLIYSDSYGKIALVEA